MALPFPYVFYACPCTDATAPIGIIHQPGPTADDVEAESEARPFDPRSSRANYTLHPLDHLLYCVDCHEMRCPRCTREEVNTWFCPACLFEASGSRVKGDQQRCGQNCFQCPICAARLTMNSLSQSVGGGTGSSPAPATAPSYYLNCPYCHWSTLEIGVRFDKPVNIASQLAKKRTGLSKSKLDRVATLASSTGSIRSISSSSSVPAAAPHPPTAPDDSFDAVLAFYRDQLKQSVESGIYSGLGDFSINSPASLSRLISFYSSSGSRRSRHIKPVIIREAQTSEEGLREHSDEADDRLIRKIKSQGWNSTASVTQRNNQARPGARFVEDLWPVAPLLRTKRSKRCRRCRQILLKPELKISTTRCKIKLLALNNVPKLLVAPLIQPTSVPSTPVQSSRPNSLTSSPVPTSTNPFVLQPYSTSYFVLTVSNPLDDPIAVHLAAASALPGFKHSRVTIMRPQFDVGANADAWDDALEPNPPSGHTGRPSGAVHGTVMAGEIWDRGRNWTSVVVELNVGCPDIPKGSDLSALDPDRFVVEIPIFVRIDYETALMDEHDDRPAEESVRTATSSLLSSITDSTGSSAAAGSRQAKVEKVEKLEQAFWTVVGVGRVMV